MNYTRELLWECDVSSFKKVFSVGPSTDS